MDLLTSAVVGLIGILVLTGLIGYAQTGYRLKNWIRELQELETRTAMQPRSRWIQRVCSDYRQYHLSGVSSLNTQALIEKHLFQERIPLVGLMRVPVGNIQKVMQQLPAFTIILGVLGTFIGLTLSLLSMQDTLFRLGNAASGPTMTMNSIISSLTAPFEGMSVAFITSIAGIGGALILNILQTGFLSRGSSLTYLQGKVMSDCEVYLDHAFNSLLLQEKPQDSAERLLDRLAVKIEESFQRSVGEFGSSMTEFTAGLKTAMEDVKGILHAQRLHSESFAASTSTLEQFGNQLQKTTEKQDSMHKAVDQSISVLTSQIKAFEQQFQKGAERQNAGQQKFEQLIQRSDKMLVESQRRSEEFAGNLTRVMQEQLQHYVSQHENLENRLGQKQEEWYYRYSEKQGEYGRAAADFASSVQLLEKGFYNAVEHIKRDFVEQIRHVLERERQISQQSQPQRNDDMRELARTLENLFHGLSRDFTSSNRTLGDMYQLLQRMYQTAVDNQTVYDNREHEARLISSHEPRRR
ncbi:hypothetical protein GA0061096_3480 [Fictibacillus enclensis]|uniref:MotA/TolQ/ExbB proton channel domain-containing protein n=1 Tax=Fictibacillus enclensis TaxID=1017270 RepID=A0A0V8J4A2_9BACL|nr:hypothetical protein [Fictibacillus enclensis]KSU81895.1 hypothetical protein AS030_16545 [Fictibacillus enclensis]SCC27592.1 hypothetical protein GA0061096_3480 [Fictibacillus enclensis]